MPYFQTAFQTSLPVSEIETRMNAITRDKRPFMEALEQAGVPERAAFVGKCSAGSLRLQRIIGYRNSFLPVIHGRIEQGVPGSVVTLRMHLHPAVAVFMALWLSFTGWNAFASFPKGIEPVAGGMFAFGAVLVCAGFYSEAIAAAKMIRRELTEGKPAT